MLSANLEEAASSSNIDLNIQHMLPPFPENSLQGSGYCNRGSSFTLLGPQCFCAPLCQLCIVNNRTEWECLFYSIFTLKMGERLLRTEAALISRMEKENAWLPLAWISNTLHNKKIPPSRNLPHVSCIIILNSLILLLLLGNPIVFISCFD